jgi:hypothetical protein
LTKRDELTQDHMRETLFKLGLNEWRVAWKPGCSSTKRGETLPESKLILVYDMKPEDAMETLLHEALEIKIRGVTQPYRSLVNVLLEWADKVAYSEKEKAIDSLLPLLQSHLGEAEPKPDPAPKGGLTDE